MSESNKKLISVAIIEDSDIHRVLFVEQLLESGRFCIVSQDQYGRSGIESVKKFKPDIVLLDFQLPDITGIEVSRRIKPHLKDIKVLAITAHTEKSIVDKIIQDKNVDGISIKGSRQFQTTFADIVESVACGESYIDPSLLTTLRISRDITGLSQLTKREFEIFMQVSVGKSDDEIANDLCVDALHVKNVRSKITKKTNQVAIKSISEKVVENA